MAQAQTTTPAPLPELPAKFEALEAVLNTELVERRAEIRASMIALVSGQHVFLLGSPGVAKSLLVNRILAYMTSIEDYEILMTRFTTPEEVVGPMSLLGLKNDQFVRKTEGYLPTAHIAFIDEIFKANSSILNTLLWAINERVYKHGTQKINIPLSTVFCASNELPQDEALNALYDRLLFRFEVKPIRDQSNFLRMLDTVQPENPQPILDHSDLEQAKAEAAQVVIPAAVKEAIAEIRRQLKEANIEPTERRFKEALKVIKATAWLDGESIADVEHLRPLKNILWERPEQQGSVDSIVLAVANPLDSTASKLLDEIIRLEDRLEKIAQLDATEKNRQGVEIHQKLKRAKIDLDDLQERAGNRRRESEVMIECKERLHSAVNRILMEVFGLDPEHASKLEG